MSKNTDWFCLQTQYQPRSFYILIFCVCFKHLFSMNSSFGPWRAYKFAFLSCKRVERPPIALMMIFHLIAKLFDEIFLLGEMTTMVWWWASKETKGMWTTVMRTCHKGEGILVKAKLKNPYLNYGKMLSSLERKELC